MWVRQLRLPARSLYVHGLLWLHRVLPGRAARNRRARARITRAALTYPTPTLVLANSMLPAERRREARAFVERVFDAQALPEADTRVLITLEPLHHAAGELPLEWVARRGEFWAEKLDQVLDAVEATPFETAARLKVIPIAPFTDYLVRPIQHQAQGRIISPFDRR